MIDLDAFEERAAIMEFDGGIGRFRAETLAAQAQGYQRREALDAISKRNSRQAQDHREALERLGSDNMPGMQRASQKQERPMPERHVQT